MQSVQSVKGHAQTAQLGRIKAHGLKKVTECGMGCSEDMLVKVGSRVLQGG